MKITVNDKEKCFVELAELDAGDTFMYGGSNSVYMLLTVSFDDNDLSVVKLNTGEVVKLQRFFKVEKVECELTVKR